MGTYAEYNGNIGISDDKREEFVEGMIKLLQLGGMMSVDKISLYGKEISLISPVCLNEEGKCQFHYNYFEDDSWETAGFDSNECRLWSNKIGWAEFNFVICAGYFLTELYSNDYGWVSENENILISPEHIQWVNYILDKDFSLVKRFNIWKNYEKHIIEDMENKYIECNTDPYWIKRLIPHKLHEFMGGTELADIFYITNGTEFEQDDDTMGAYAREVLNLKCELRRFYKCNADEGRAIVWNLIKQPLDSRKKIKGTDYDWLAEYSTRLAARVFVYLTAEIQNLSFWDEWIKIYRDVYDDEISAEYVSNEILCKRKNKQAESLGKIKTSAFLRNDGCFTFKGTPEEIKHKGNYYISDDDLLYWWEPDGKIDISEKMNSQVKRWKCDFDDILDAIDSEELNSFDMVKSLISILYDSNEYYRRIFAFNAMFYDFLENGRNKNYMAAIKLYEKVVEDNKKDGAIIEKLTFSWDTTSKNVTFNEGRVTLKRFLSIMANKKLRLLMFGF